MPARTPRALVAARARAKASSASTAWAGQQLEQASGDYTALDTKALALCGLALTTEPAKAAEACTRSAPHGR